jgi:hypothetical protein
MPEQNSPPIPPSTPGNGLGIASLIIGLTGFILCFIPVINVIGLILAIVALILGIAGMIMAKKKGGSPALPLLGILLGAFSIIVFIIMYATMVSV